jgi:hypothetical protein
MSFWFLLHSSILRCAFWFYCFTKKYAALVPAREPVHFSVFYQSYALRWASQDRFYAFQYAFNFTFFGKIFIYVFPFRLNIFFEYDCNECLYIYYTIQSISIYVGPGVIIQRVQELLLSEKQASGVSEHMRLTQRSQVTLNSLNEKKWTWGACDDCTRDVKEHATLCSEEMCMIRLKAHFPRTKSLRRPMCEAPQ